MSEPRDAARSLCVRFFLFFLTRTGLTAIYSALPMNPSQHNRRGKQHTRWWWKAGNKHAALQHNAGYQKKKKEPKKINNANDRTRDCFQTETTTDVAAFHLKCNLHFIFLEYFLSGLYVWIAASEAKQENDYLLTPRDVYQRGSHSSTRKTMEKRHCVGVS